MERVLKSLTGEYVAGKGLDVGILVREWGDSEDVGTGEDLALFVLVMDI